MADKFKIIIAANSSKSSNNSSSSFISKVAIVKLEFNLVLDLNPIHSDWYIYLTQAGLNDSSVVNLGPSPLELAKVNIDVPEMALDSSFQFITNITIKTRDGTRTAKVAECRGADSTYLTSEGKKRDEVKEPGPVKRKKRDVNEADVNRRNSQLFCDTAKCRQIECDIVTIAPNDGVRIDLELKIDAKILEKLKLPADIIDFTTEARAAILNTPIDIQPVDHKPDSTRVITSFDTGRTSPQEIPGWVIPVSIILGILLLLIVAAVFYKVGFFQRSDREALLQAQEDDSTDTAGSPENTNAFSSHNNLIDTEYDYLSKYKAPNLNKLAENGVKSTDGMIPSFPTVTFCNHQTLVTGLFPESHGIVYNRMYDPVFNESFAYGNDSKWYSAAEPIWITAKQSGLKTGVSFWPGSTVNYNDVKNDFTEGFERNQNFSKRVDTAIDWLTKKNLNFVAVYFEQPDGEGHAFGPESVQVGNMVEIMDNIVGDIFTAKIFDKINIIVTSDHGMSAINLTEPNALVLTKHLDQNDYELVSQFGAVGAVLPKKGKEDKVFNDLNNKHPHVKIYHKKDIPERLHYQHNRRIMPIIAIAEEHYFVSYNGSEFKNDTVKGIHGYDNNLVNMRALFIASGPSFKRNVELASFNNVDVYSLMCHLLEITPKPSNGSLASLKSILMSVSIVVKPPFYLVSVMSVSFQFSPPESNSYKNKL
uniref:Integrin alpha third immunoglobulin-like domain-containing protein n=1 Tax=Strigamia maritima TaxID=126957 RepID=T1JIG3_STRMM